MAKIILLGNYRVPWTSETHFARELESLGHDLCRVQEPPGGGDRATLRYLECEADLGADLLIWVRTWGLPVDATRLWRKLEKNGTQTASYHLDLYVPLARGTQIEKDPFWTTGTVFTPDGNPESEAYFARHGINHVWSPPGVVSDECVSGTFRKQYAYDVIFVGSEDNYHYEWPWRGRLIKWLRATYRDGFRAFGGVDTVRGQALNDLYASAKVVVGDSCFARADQRYFSDRPFETYGRGGCMVFPQIDLLEEMIGRYPSYTVGDFDGLRTAIDAALASPLARVGAVGRLQERVRTAHTYRHRLAAALEHLGIE